MSADTTALCGLTGECHNYESYPAELHNIIFHVEKLTDKINVNFWYIITKNIHKNIYQITCALGGVLAKWVTIYNDVQFYLVKKIEYKLVYSVHIVDLCLLMCMQHSVVVSPIYIYICYIIYNVISSVRHWMLEYINLH